MSQRDRGEQTVLARGNGDQIDVDAGVAVTHRYRAGLAAGCGGDQQILDGAAEADPQVMIVGIHDGRAPRKIRHDADPARASQEAPGLGVVAIGRERCEAYEISEGC